VGLAVGPPLAKLDSGESVDSPNKGLSRQKGLWSTASKGVSCKWKLRSKISGRERIFHKLKGESREHVLMKGLLWALHEKNFPEGVEVERKLEGSRYKPDCIALDPANYSNVLWWGEAGGLSSEKWISLLDEHPNANFTFAKWDVNVKGVYPSFATLLKGRSPRRRKGWRNGKRTSNPPNCVEIISFPGDSGERFISALNKGNMSSDAIENLEVGEVEVQEDQIQRIILAKDGTILGPIDPNH